MLQNTRSILICMCLVVFVLATPFHMFGQLPPGSICGMQPNLKVQTT